MKAGDGLYTDGVHYVEELDHVERSIASLNPGDESRILLQRTGQSPLTQPCLGAQFAHQIAQDVLLASSEALPISSSQYWQS